MSEHRCKRCGSQAVVRERDLDTGGTMEKCVACGHEDYATFRPVRDLPCFVSPTTLDGYRDARSVQCVTLFMDGNTAAEVANRMGLGVRTVYRYWMEYLAAQRSQAVTA